MTANPEFRGSDALRLAGGLALVLVSGHFLVESATTIARLAGISEWVIGGTIVAAGTSTPEFAVSLIALRRESIGVSVGNVIGSNIYNLIGILGLAALIRPLTVNQEAIGTMIWLTAIVLLLVAALWTGRQLSRAEGGVFAFSELLRWVLNLLRGSDSCLRAERRIRLTVGGPRLKGYSCPLPTHISMRMHWTARTVAIVGPDGSGKTTQARLLTERLRAAGYDAQYVHALYYLSDILPQSDRLRKRVGPRKTRTQTQAKYNPSYLARRLLFGWFGYWFALITIAFVSVRFRNRVVVFDRYYQQFLYDVYGLSAIPLSHSLPQPWRTIYLDTDLDTLRTRQRVADRTVNEQYYVLASDVYDACTTDDWRRVRGELPVETLHEQIFEEIRRSIDSKRATVSESSPIFFNSESIDVDYR